MPDRSPPPIADPTRDHWRSLAEAELYAFVRPRVLDHRQAETIVARVLAGASRRTRPDSRQPSIEALLDRARGELRRLAVGRSNSACWTAACLAADRLDPPSASAQPTHESAADDARLLEQLGPSQRDALRLRYEAGMSLEQISQRTRRGVAAVLALLREAREPFRADAPPIDPTA